MKTMTLRLIFVLFFIGSVGQTQTKIAVPEEEGRIKFDPARDAARDIEDAILLAQKEKKHILLDVGGEWCVWCHRFDKFFMDNKDLSDYLGKNYITVKINFSPENKNEKVLSRFPKIQGYPHLFVLDEKGILIHSQDTGLLELEKSYDHDKVLEFLKQWAPETI